MKAMPLTEELTRDECVELLKTNLYGRVALSTPTGPSIVPMPHRVDGDALIFRVAAHSILGTYAPDTMLAFQSDCLPHDGSAGWSVLVKGLGRLVQDAAELTRMDAVWPSRSTGSCQRSLILRLPMTAVTGLRMEIAGTWIEPELRAKAV